MPHRNARLTVHARLLVVERFRAGSHQARIAERLGVSRGTVGKWIDRYDTEGPAGLEDRSSRPHTTPRRTPAEAEARVLAWRAERHRGAVFLASELGLVASTVGRILHRHQVPPLAAIDPISGEPVRQRRGGPRYERRRPDELLHVDVKKLGRVPDGGGWRLHGRSEAVRGRGNGYATTCTSPWTTTPGWPTSRLCPTNATLPARHSCTAPRAGSTPAESPSNACSPTTP